MTTLTTDSPRLAFAGVIRPAGPAPIRETYTYDAFAALAATRGVPERHIPSLWQMVADTARLAARTAIEDAVERGVLSYLEAAEWGDEAAEAHVIDGCDGVAPVDDRVHCWYRNDDGSVCGQPATHIDVDRAITVCPEHACGALHVTDIPRRAVG